MPNAHSCRKQKQGRLPDQHHETALEHGFRKILFNACPCFVTSYPSQSFFTSYAALAGGADATITLTARALNVKKTDTLLLTIGERLYKTELELIIPTDQYLSIIEHTR